MLTPPPVLLQLADGLCNCTLYIGGSASFEAVEDVFHHNLRLVAELFDTDSPMPPPPPVPLTTTTPPTTTTTTTKPTTTKPKPMPRDPPHQTSKPSSDRSTPHPPPTEQPDHQQHQHQLLRAAVSRAPPPLSRAPPRANVLEQLVSEVPCDRLDAYLRADAATWTAFLRDTPGYVRKAVGVARRNSSGAGGGEGDGKGDRSAGGGDGDGDGSAGDGDGDGDGEGDGKQDGGSGGATGTCEVRTDVGWLSRELWKAIPPEQLAATERAFEAAFGADPPTPTPLPASGDGLLTLLRVPRREALADGQVEERLVFSGVSCGAGVAAFVAADNASYTAFLKAQPGFVAREILLDDSAASAAASSSSASASAASAAAAAAVETRDGGDGGDGGDGESEQGRLEETATATATATAPPPNCSVYSRTRWADEAAFAAVCAPGGAAAACATVHAHFVDLLGGRDPPMRRLPLTTAAADDEAPHGPRMAVLGGIDVVAYHALPPGAHDVRGAPAHRRWLDASALLPPRLLPYHPRPYELWFSSEANAAAFEAAPRRFLPAFGGHCTHGTASRGDLNATLLADGRVAFACVNGSRWDLRNGTTYMNSCGMWPDFERDPAADIAASRAAWRGWFGDFYGPLNDACVQDEAAWGGDPIGGLVPRECVLN